MSPNYLGTDKEEQETEPRIGEAYQAKVPKFRKNKLNAQKHYGKEGVLIWCTKKDADEKHDLETKQFVETAVKSYGLDIHAALGLLFWYRHDIARAQICLQKFQPGKFTSEEEDQFNEAVLSGNKEQRMEILKDRLPNRSYKEVVARYYQWRASRKSQSLMDTKVEDVEQRIKVESDEVEARAIAAREAEEDDGLPPPSHRNHLRMQEELERDDMSLEDDDEPEDPISIVRRKVLEEDLKEPRFTAKISKDELEDALHRRRTKQTEPTVVNHRDDEVARYKSEVQLAKQICSKIIIPLKLEAPPSVEDLNNYIETLRISKSHANAKSNTNAVKCEEEAG